MERRAYPSDVGDEEWAFVAPYLTLMSEQAHQRVHSLREIFNGLRWIIRAGAAWRSCCRMIYPRGQQFINKQGRWIKAGVFEAIVDDLRVLLLCSSWAG